MNLRHWFGRPKPSHDGSRSEPVDEGRALVDRWLRGDRTAFSDIFRAYRKLVYGILRHLLGNDPDIDDVVQLAFIEVFRSLATFEGRSKLSSWIARIALHAGYHHLRHRRNHPSDFASEHDIPDLADSSAHGDTERGIRQREAMARVHAIVATIATKKRTVFVLNDLEGMSQEDIAEVVGTSIATVRTRLFHARREFWKHAENDEILRDYSDAGVFDARVSSRPRAQPDGGRVARPIRGVPE